MMLDNQEAAASASSEALVRLAKRLYSQLDPVEGEPEWSALPDDHRNYYRQLIEDLVGSPDLALAALSTKGNADRRSGGPMARRTPWILPLLGVLLVAAVIYGDLWA